MLRIKITRVKVLLFGAIPQQMVNKHPIQNCIPNTNSTM